jgi:hypothetical protein
MAASPVGWSEIWRVLAYAVAIALAFVVLGRLESGAMSLFDLDNRMARTEFGSTSGNAALAREAERIALASRDTLAQTPGRRGAAFRLGYELGYASTFVGSFANSDPAVQAKARMIGERHVVVARMQAAAFGIAGVDLLRAPTLSDYVALNDRFEADENGVGAKVEARASPLHRQLYVLGALVGGEAADVESSGGRSSQPPGPQIRRHATLAGVDRALWLPLALTPRDTPPEQVLGNYRGALEVLAADLAARDAASAGAAPPR